MKRYAIVRVDNKCIFELENKIKMNCNAECFINEQKCSYDKIYGDTKEQLTLKIAQVLARKYLRDLKCATYTNSDVIANDVKNFYKLAKEIVEFLGVK